MARFAKLTIVSALLATLALAGTAEGHRLTVSRAAKANRTFARLLCNATNDPKEVCVSSRAGRCKRISAHRVRCVFFLTVEGEDKSQARCRGLLEWLVRGRSNELQPVFLGIRRCTQVRAPQAEPEPEP